MRLGHLASRACAAPPVNREAGGRKLKKTPLQPRKSPNCENRRAPVRADGAATGARRRPCALSPIGPRGDQGVETTGPDGATRACHYGGISVNPARTAGHFRATNGPLRGASAVRRSSCPAPPMPLKTTARRRNLLTPHRSALTFTRARVQCYLAP